MLERVKDPAFWAEVRREERYAEVRRQLLERWETECDRDIPTPTYSQYRAFFLTGSRKPFEGPYICRRNQTGISGLLALIYPEEEKYLKKMIDALWATLDEYSWTPPEHEMFFSGDPAEDIDLFSSETAQQIAEICEVFGDRLPEDVRVRAESELARRILRGFENNTYEWESCGNNWMMVCLSGVTAVILHLCPGRLEEFLPRMRHIVRGYFDSYKDDGVCVEGLVYWGYGISKLIELSDLVEEATQGRVRLWEESGEKWKAVFAWYSRMALGHGSAVTFDDMSREQTYNRYLAGYFSRRWPQFDITRGEAKPGRIINRDPFTAYLREILWYSEPDPAPVPVHTEYFPDTGWLVMSGKEYGFAAKGGENIIPYHADLGAFLVAKGGVQILTDPGAGEYTQEYFTRRYENFHVSSRGHCVPIVGGKYQLAGDGIAAPTSWDGKTFTAELSRAYDAPGLASLRRSLVPEPDRVVLEDRWVFEEGTAVPVTERFVTQIEPERAKDGYRLGEAVLRMAREDAERSRITVETPPARDAYYCIDVRLPAECRSFRAELVLTGE